MNAAADHQTTHAGWYTVEVRQYTDPYEGAAQIAGLRVQSIKFTVEQDSDRGPSFAGLETTIREQRYNAAVTAMGAVATGTDWPAGTYLVTVEGRHASTAYVARLGEHREFNMETAKPADWVY